MYTLVDRADGSVIANVSDADFQVLSEHLTAEHEEDFDFYVNEATLAYLGEQGLSADVISSFDGKLTGRGMDLGWEKETGDTETLHTGRVLDDEGQPLGGIRVDLLDDSPLKTGQLHSGRALIDWTYSRSDGAFTLETTPDNPGTELRFSGRGALVLATGSVGEVGDQGEFTVQTITGAVKDKDGEVISGVSVQLLNWNLVGEDDSEDVMGGTLSWGDSGEDGRFAIPVHVPTGSGMVSIKLEILAPSGESLLEGEYSFNPDDTFDIGEVMASNPSEEWGVSEEEVQVGAPDRAIERPLL